MDEDNKRTCRTKENFCAPASESYVLLDVNNKNGSAFVPCGLINRNNSCFANSVLQCLSFTQPLMTFLLQEEYHRKSCTRQDCMLCDFLLHMRDVREASEPFYPLRILSYLPKNDCVLMHGKQHDCQEFLRFILNELSSCLPCCGDERFLRFPDRNTIVTQIFGGTINSEIKCCSCNDSKTINELVMDFLLEMKGGVLQDCLKSFTTYEIIDARCDKCECKQKLKRFLIHDAPNVLTIVLKRYENLGITKLDKIIRYPISLNLQPYMTKNDGRHEYELYAVIVHQNYLSSTENGHYFCYVNKFDGSWSKIDDEKVFSVPIEEVLGQEAYMLLYSRTKAHPGPLLGFEEQPINVREVANEGFTLSSSAQADMQKIQNNRMMRSITMLSSIDDS